MVKESVFVNLCAENSGRKRRVFSVDAEHIIGWLVFICRWQSNVIPVRFLAGTHFDFREMIVTVEVSAFSTAPRAERAEHGENRDAKSD